MMTDENEEEVALLPNKSSNKQSSCLGSLTGWLPARHALAFWAFMGFFNVYCLRVNLSVALVAMVNSTATANSSVSEECPDTSANSSSATVSSGEFFWNEKTQGLVLGAFFYGYILTQLPGGWLAERVGGKKLFGFGCLSTALLTLLTPVAARAGVPYLIVVRVLEGIGEGVTFPAMHAMWSEWAPIYERSKLAGFTYSGAQLGTVFSMPLSGLLCQHGFAGGWPSVFYVFGSLACLWFIFWMLLVHDSPSQHPRISDAERQYIESSIGQRQRLPTPWRHILTSPAVWALSAAHFSTNWGFYSMLTCLPTYFKTILHFKITQNGFLSGVPYLVLWVTQVMSGFLADFIRRRGYLSTGTTRKVMNSAGSVLPACFLLATGYTGCDFRLAVVLLTLGVGSGGFTMAGYNVNHLDIAPRFAGTLLGITNAIATIPGFVGPAVVGILTNNNETSGQWRIFFYITAAIYLSGALIFVLFGKGEEQDWAKSGRGTYSVLDQEKTVSVQRQHSSHSDSDSDPN